MNELEQLKSIAEHLEAIRSHSTAGTLADLSDWLYKDAPRLLPLIDSAMQYAAEILSYNAEMDKPHLQAELNAELEQAAGMGLTNHDAAPALRAG